MAEHRPPILWSPEALDDIDHLWDYYARAAGPVTADKIIREIAKVVTTIDDFPLLQGACVTKSGRVCAHSPLLLRSYFTV
jgi:plasmid stabilization system protein ParE